MYHQVSGQKLQIRVNQALRIIMANLVFGCLVVLLACCFMAGPGPYVVAFEAAEAPPSPAEAENRTADHGQVYYESISTNGDYSSSGYDYSSAYHSYDLDNDYGDTEYESGTLIKTTLLSTAFRILPIEHRLLGTAYCILPVDSCNFITAYKKPRIEDKFKVGRPLIDVGNSI